MRALFVTMAVIAALGAVSGCSSAGNDLAAVQAMNNPPNSCGPGGSRDIEDCSNIR